VKTADDDGDGLENQLRLNGWQNGGQLRAPMSGALCCQPITTTASVESYNRHCSAKRCTQWWAEFN